MLRHTHLWAAARKFGTANSPTLCERACVPISHSHTHTHSLSLTLSLRISLSLSLQCPVFKTETGEVLLESGAIAMHLLEKYGGLNHALFGKPEQRAKLLQWLWYTPSTLYSAMGAFWMGDDASKAEAQKKLEKQHLVFIASELGSKPYILGDDFTLADVFLGYEMSGLHYLKSLANFPTLVAYVERVNARPSFIAAFENEGDADKKTSNEAAEEAKKTESHHQQQQHNGASKSDAEATTAAASAEAMAI